MTTSLPMKLTPHQVQQFLSNLWHTQIATVQPVGLGEWSQAFYFSASGQEYVIRFSPLDEDFRKDQFAAQFASPQLPIPDIIEVGAALEGYYAISPRVGGTVIDYLDAGEMQRALPALLALLNALRETDTSMYHGYGGIGVDGHGSSPSWKNFLSQVIHDTPDRRIYGWQNFLTSQPEAYDVFQQAYQQFLTLQAVCPEDRCLVHNDLLHFNLIIKDSQIAGVIDWGCALYGDFLYDLAMFTTWQFYYPAMAEIDFIAEAAAFFTAKNVSIPYLRERIQCYQLHLLLDSLTYNAYKQDTGSLALTTSRLKQLMQQ